MISGDHIIFCLLKNDFVKATRLPSRFLKVSFQLHWSNTSDNFFKTLGSMPFLSSQNAPFGALTPGHLCYRRGSASIQQAGQPWSKIFHEISGGKKYPNKNTWNNKFHWNWRSKPKTKAFLWPLEKVSFKWSFWMVLTRPKIQWNPKSMSRINCLNFNHSLQTSHVR